MNPTSEIATLQSRLSASGMKPNAVVPGSVLGGIFLVFAVLLISGSAADFFNAGEDLPTRVTIGRLIASFGLLTCCILSYRNRLVTAFIIFSGVYILGLLNAAFVAGFGINSPALLVVLVPVVIALGLFDRRQAFFWCLPVMVPWVAVVYVHFSNPSLFSALLPAGTPPPEPSKLAWLFGCLLTIVPTAAITWAAQRRFEKLLVEERLLLANSVLILDKQQKWLDERDEFMARVSHELRTPLAAMRNALTLSRHPKASEVTKERSLNTLDTSIGNLNELLNDVLDAFKYGSAGFSLSTVPFSLTQALEDINTLYNSLASQKGLQLLFERRTTDTDTLVGDPVRLKQMLSNLISNAIKFTAEGHISVHVELVDYHAHMWRFEVEDTGPGISEEDQKRLFKPFAQLEDQTHGASTIKGTGLGLSIVAQLAQAMGGTTGLTSQPGQGSTFYFEIPLPSVSRPLASTIAA